MKPDTLLPCPFCAGAYPPAHPKMSQTAPATSKPMLEELTTGGWRVCCYGCGVQTWDNLKYTKPQAVAAWNTRPEDSNAKRLRWLIDHGYTPAQWRPWTPSDGPAHRFPNGHVMLGMGGIPEIDAAMERGSKAPPH